MDKKEWKVWLWYNARRYGFGESDGAGERVLNIASAYEIATLNTFYFKSIILRIRVEGKG